MKNCWFSNADLNLFHIRRTTDFAVVLFFYILYSLLTSIHFAELSADLQYILFIISAYFSWTIQFLVNIFSNFLPFFHLALYIYKLIYYISACGIATTNVTPLLTIPSQTKVKIKPMYIFKMYAVYLYSAFSIWWQKRDRNNVTKTILNT